MPEFLSTEELALSDALKVYHDYYIPQVSRMIIRGFTLAEQYMRGFMPAPQLFRTPC